jgi:hypothetical protein
MHATDSGKVRQPLLAQAKRFAEGVDDGADMRCSAHRRSVYCRLQLGKLFTPCRTPGERMSSKTVLVHPIIRLTDAERIAVLERTVEELRQRITELERENERQADYEREQAEYE